MKRILSALSIERVIDNTDAFSRARTVIPFFYYFLLFLAFFTLEGMTHTIAQGGAGFTPRWPIFWAEGFPYSTVVSGIIMFFVVSSLVGSLWYHSRLARITAFLGIFQYHAFRSSFGGPNHQLDLWLWVALLLIFLPDAWKEHAEKEEQKKFLYGVWATQAFILLTYTMSGIGKLYGGISQLLQGQASIFSLDAASLHIATLLYQMGETTPLGPLLVEYPSLGWLLFWGVLYVQVFSLLIAFRPSLHRLWGAGLILFQFGTFLAMRAIFITPIAIVGLFLLGSPFAPERIPWKKVLKELPLLKEGGEVVKAVLNKGKKRSS